MITPRTQAAIALLRNIGTPHQEEGGISEEERHELLHRLAAAGLIRPVRKGGTQGIEAYAPAKRPADVSLLDILEATGEHLNCDHPTTEEFYSRYGKAAQKLGVLNQIIRTYLQEIRLSDL